MSIVAGRMPSQGIQGLNAREWGVSDEAKIKTSTFLNLKDENKKRLFEVLIDRWVLYRIGQDVAYTKHIFSGRINVLYQIILSGNCWDGIYEFTLKGKKIETAGHTLGNKNILSIKSRGNYGLATFNKNTPSPYFVSRCDFDTDKEFLSLLSGTGLISQKEIDTYYQPSEVMRAYLAKTLPQVVFS